MNSDSLRALTGLVVSFRDERDWKQFHRPKDLALSLMLEAAELAELTQWKNGDALDEHLAENRERVGEELSDVLYWVLLIAHDLDIDLGEAFIAKLRNNAEKYPVDKARGSSLKYDRLG